ncbi:MAG TPA: hypothetical protein PLB89_04975 [Flavobacteriales bacterium]|nr:hypothetical protein [Flavobacteriales bacterium]
MGYSSYSTSDREERSERMNYRSAPREEVFTQQKLRTAHELMLPRGVVFRECRDSAAHANATPIQLYLDVTGSMGHIPHELIKTGLPHLMSTLIQNGVPDAALMFGAVGDHECDNFPLQVAQFESGDAELDMWLTRTYLESGGGGNAGESYMLAWYFAAHHVRTDAFEKRGQKGFVITIGDEPCLPNLPASAVQAIMGSSAAAQGNFTKEVLLAEAQKSNHVYHIFIEHGHRTCDDGWRQLMGQNLVLIQDHTAVPSVIASLILRHTSAVTQQAPPSPSAPVSNAPEGTHEEML